MFLSIERMRHEQLIIEVLDLAERILDEATSADQDWSAIEHMANAVSELAAEAACGVRARGRQDPSR